MTENPTATSIAELSGLPPALTITQAGALLGLGRSNAYRLLRESRFPVPLLPVPGRCKVATAAVLELLGVPLFGTTGYETDNRILHKDFDGTA